jgi:hypothetical protein
MSRFWKQPVATLTLTDTQNDTAVELPGLQFFAWGAA